MAHWMKSMRTAFTKGPNDQGDWFRCPRCNFVIKDSRTSTPEMANVVIEDSQVPSSGLNYADNSNMDVMCTLENPHFLGSIAKIGRDGTNAIEDYYSPRVYLPSAGCPFCGQVWLER